MTTPRSPVNSRSDGAVPELPSDLAVIERRFVLSSTTLEVAGRPTMLTRPRSADDLISEADFAKDERLPYWADIWPSSTVFASLIAGRDGEGRTALELGCGLGLVTLAALRAGYDVTFVRNYTDVDDKLIVRGHELRIDPLALADQNIAQWEAEQAALGLTPPDVRPSLRACC